MMRYFFSILFVVGCLAAKSQTKIFGTIEDVTGEPLIGASVTVKGTTIGCVTDLTGFFEMEEVPVGYIDIQISFIGYESKILNVKTEKGKNSSLDISLNPSQEVLNEVAVTGKSKEQIKREQAIKIEVVEVEKFEAQATSIVQRMNQVTGVKSLQTAGVGSETNIQINGLQGKSIRYFINNVPMDYMGRAFDMGLVPVDQVSNIEVYKGVLPVELGADALGGAVNIIKKRYKNTTVNASYQLESFNTHIVNSNLFFRKKDSNLFAEAKINYITSDNDYPFEGAVLDESTQTYDTLTVKRFHDGIKRYYGEVSIGVDDTKVADLLEISAAYFKYDKEVQTGIVLSDPVGEAMEYEKSGIYTINYQKELYKLNLHIFGAYGDIYTQSVDTSDNLYNWYGEIINQNSPNSYGEAGGNKMLRSINYDNYVGRAFVSYDLWPSHTMKFSYNYIDVHRIGEDPLGERDYITGLDPLTIPARYTRHIGGAGISSCFLGKRLQNNFTFKYYSLKAELSGVESVGFDGEDSHRKSDQGIGNSIKFSFSDDSFVRFSAEHTFRIPSFVEYLGDNLYIKGNKALQPEKSNNANLGFFTNLDSNRSLWLDLNLFYRHVQDYVALRPLGFYYSRYVNTDDAKIKGIEMALKWRIAEAFQLNTAVTYQDMRRINAEYSSLENSRIPNVPYLFSNINAFKTVKNAFRLPVDINVYGNYNYTEQYLLNPLPTTMEPKLFQRDIKETDEIIPSQHQVDMGVTVKLKKYPLSINAEVVNLTNSRLYDKFRIQKPSRYYRMKISYKII